MIARVTVKLPFEFTLPDGEEYLGYEYTHKGCLVLIYPPISQAKEPIQNGITIDDRPSHQVDTLVIDFQKNEFNREVNSEYDPSVDVIKEVINDFLNRIRYVVKAAQIKPITSDTDLHVQYLNDDFTELEKIEGYIRGRGTKSFKFNATAITSDIWNNVHSLPPFSELPIWRTLLLDAEALLPEVGPSVVLTFTALEVFIAKILDLKVNHEGKDNVLWEWINDRGDSYSKKTKC